MSHKSFPYARIATFGQLNKVLQTDPVGYSIYKDIDSSFDQGPTSRLFGPDQPNAQLYMAEKCSKEWDGACELLSRNTDGTKCNVGKIDSPLFKSPSPAGMTIGDFLVENTATRRFCDLSSCKMTHESYNPMDPNSPFVTSYGSCGFTDCLPVCTPPDNPDNDIVLNKVLEKPHMHVDLLVNMYDTINRSKQRSKYEKTRLGMVFNVLDVYFQKKK
jgi:hypothetical protein